MYLGHHQAQTAIDHSQSQKDSPRPGMSDRPCGTLMILLIHVMVDEASYGLKSESSDNDNSNDGMTITSRKLDAG